MKTFSRISVTLFILIIICFFLPFADITCSGHKIGTVTGFQMATGGTMQDQRMDPEPLAVLAFIAAIAGIFMSFAGSRSGRVLPIIAGVAGGIFLLLLKSQLDKEAIDEGYGMLAAEYQLGYWGSVSLFFIAAALNLFASMQAKDTG